MFGSATLAGRSVAPTHRLAACDTLKLLPATRKAALRATLGLVATMKDSVALPVPDVVGIVIHDGRTGADHEHPAGAVTATVDVPPAVVNERKVGEMVGAGAHAPADWFTRKLTPAMLSTALRATPTFCAAVRVMPAGPVPLLLVVSHAGAPVTDHVHPAQMARETVDVPPAAAIDRLGGLSVGLMHGLACWLTANALSAMLSVAVRAGPVFAATE